MWQCLDFLNISTSEFEETMKKIIYSSLNMQYGCNIVGITMAYICCILELSYVRFLTFCNESELNRLVFSMTLLDA